MNSIMNSVKSFFVTGQLRVKIEYIFISECDTISKTSL